jgi:ribosomal protein S18 acetylase RimI-like enzyme
MSSIVSENPLATRGRVRQAGRVDPAARLRDVTEDDAGAIFDLCVLSDIAVIGEPNTTIDLVRSDLAGDHMVAAVAEDGDGALIGYVWLEFAPAHSKTWGDLTLRPGADGAVAEVMLEWLRARSSELGPGLPTHTFADSNDLMKRRLYESAGGTVIRHFYRMGVSFDETPPAPVPALAEGVEIRGLERTDADLRVMHNVVDVAFLDHFGHEPEDFTSWRQHTAEGFASDLTLWWLASADGVPAAGLYGSLLPDAGYVDSLATLREHRGKGLGRALLLTAFGEFAGRGLRRVVLGVDASNPTGALALYESVGMKAEHEGLRYELPSLP